jgi:hypothetical protein
MRVSPSSICSYVLYYEITTGRRYCQKASDMERRRKNPGQESGDRRDDILKNKEDGQLQPSQKAELLIRASFPQFTICILTFAF